MRHYNTEADQSPTADAENELEDDSKDEKTASGEVTGTRKSQGKRLKVVGKFS